MNDSQSQVHLRLANRDDVGLMLGIIVSAFSARRVLDPPTDALSDTVEAVRARLDGQLGIIASVEDTAVGCLFLALDRKRRIGTVHRVSVLPQTRRQGVATHLATAAAELAVDAGMTSLQLIARRELPEVIGWWVTHGFRTISQIDEHNLLLGVELPVRLKVPTSEVMASLGSKLAGVLRGGDVIVANGDLGAGKTTLAQGLGQGLSVSGPITSPTFVLSRIHPSRTGPQLVHVDAYRLASAAEVDDLDLDDSLTGSVTFIEWGAGLVEQLSADRLEIDIERSPDIDDDTRTVTIRAVGSRWADVDLHALFSEEL